MVMQSKGRWEEETDQEGKNSELSRTGRVLLYLFSVLRLTKRARWKDPLCAVLGREGTQQPRLCL